MMSVRGSMDRDIWLAQPGLARNRVLIPDVSRTEPICIRYPRSSPIPRREVSHTALLRQLHKFRIILVIFLPPQPYPNFHNRHPAHTLRHHPPSDDWQQSNPAGAYLQGQCSASDGLTATCVVTNAPPEPFLLIDFACRIHMGRTLLILVSMHAMVSSPAVWGEWGETRPAVSNRSFM